MFEDQKKNNEGKDERGLFEAGNQLWRQRSKHGLSRIFETPADLEKVCIEYFEWADSNPLQEDKVFGTGLRAKVAHPRALTQRGLCVYAGISQRTWRDYRQREEYAEICEMVEDIIFEQKFAGAAAGFFNATIIARDLGLADQQNSNLTVVINQEDDDL